MQFEAFYDFALARVYPFAYSRMGTASEAEALSELILVSALTSIGGAHAPGNRLRGNPAELAFTLLAIVRRVSDQVAANPLLLDRPPTALGVDFDGRCEVDPPQFK